MFEDEFWRAIDGRKILKWHAALLIFLTTLLTLAAYVGVLYRAGPYSPLATNSFALAGLVQAYPLIGLVAICMWRGANGSQSTFYSKIAIIAHSIPLLTLLFLWDPIIRSSIGWAVPLSVLIHGGGIGVESISLWVGHSPHVSKDKTSRETDLPGTMRKKNLDECFGRFDDLWSPKIAGGLNDTHLKLAKFGGAFLWHKHEQEDELFMVHKGRLRIRLRDRDEVLEQGEFFIVPKGVEHCPEALTETCEVILLEPASILNTGNVTDRRTVRQLEFI